MAGWELVIWVGKKKSYHKVPLIAAQLITFLSLRGQKVLRVLRRMEMYTFTGQSYDNCSTPSAEEDRVKLVKAPEQLLNGKLFFM